MPNVSTDQSPRRIGLVLALSLLFAGLMPLSADPARAQSAAVPAESAHPARLPSPGLFGSPSASAPPFFKVGGGKGAQIYLLGTVHLGPEAGWTYPRAIRRALDSADTLVLELDMRQLDEETVSQAVIQHALLPVGQRLSKSLGPKTLELITKYDDDFREAGLPFLAREGLRPWFIATSLSELAAMRSGYSMDQSADEQVMATLGDRELIALETLDDQLGFFDALSFETQEAMLADTLMRWDGAASSLRDLVSAWREGEESELIKLTREGLDSEPALEPFFEILLDQRNERWAKRLIEILNAPERDGTDVFVAVGAMHVVGPNSLPELLEKAGFKVKNGNRQ